MIRQRDYLRAKANKTGSSVLKQAYSQVRARVNQKVHELRKNYYTRKIEQHKHDLKNTWKVLKGAIGKANKTIEIEKINFEGKEFTDKEQITELCNDHFVSIGDKFAKSTQPGNEQSPTVHIQPATVKFRFKPISVLQVTKVIKKLVKRKATGIHGIPNKALKECAENIAPSLTDILNFSIETGVFPDDLKVCRVAPVDRSGEKDDLNNYRTISVLYTVARVFEKMLYGQVYDYFTSNKLSGNQQFGFRTLHSTALALSKCKSNWWLNMDRGDMTSVVFLDIRKAFDTVNHQILSDKLHCYGIGDGELLFFRFYLQNGTQCCSVNGHILTLQKVTCGVPQGPILGPLLLLFI